ncbi:DUF4468 domain-containing protein [Autumnicola psychrophila]|uniref:DUF4468 domain-containing protein n=1 Tax=Autumnicola psychrophila TaxID=3075592 RepID=A0ABU3DVT4_9FLAO|nr:DUF4468 domain-containing protein [Zunongwangia sp. F225]MDT0687829.1 DUF4468 domain-containing protein [Zunongwangia sp. F225]
MKKLLLLLLLTTLISCGGYESTAVSIEPVEKVFQLDQDKSDLYIKANQWMVENFGSAEEVIQFSDKESGVVTGKYLIGETFRKEGYAVRPVYAIIKAQVKDGAAKLSIDPEEYIYTTGFGHAPQYVITESDVRNSIEQLMSSFEIYMNQEIDTDW